ncbi:SPFH domain-containing protein [Ornithinimicrobium flavum]|uniref:SPFH domain-containing protein n=1 Tax=Ornithinimicrobium flavum TaxID=1288636 RepID=UPI00107008B5|nr:SPFH domain-containing protein [Ornithinimicrobium flavum]
MAFFTVATTLAVIALVAFVAGRWVRSSRWVGAVAAVLLVAYTALNSFVTLDHREVGIQTALGRYISTLNTGGIHYKSPWSSVEKFDQTIQTVDLSSISVSFSDGGGVEGIEEIGGGKGLINATVRWQMSRDEDGARLLWERYRTFESVSASLVERTARDAVINIANAYPAATAIISQREIAEQVRTEVERSLDPYGVVIDSVSIPAIDLDDSTQAAVDRLFTTQQDIKRAQNEQRRAEIDAETVRIREAEGALSPAANQRYCLEIVNAWDVAQNGPLPATFNCAMTGSGDSPAIIVDGSSPTPSGSGGSPAPTQDEEAPEAEPSE